MVDVLAVVGAVVPVFTHLDAVLACSLFAVIQAHLSRSRCMCEVNI